MRTGNNAAIFFRDANSDKHRIWLNLSNATGMQNQILIGYMEGATQDADVSIDAKQIEGSINNIASMIGEDKYNIQARALPFVDTDIVPLAFKAIAAGDFSISIDHSDGLFEDFEGEGQAVFLKDNLLGIVHNLKAAPYDFASAEGNFTNRFEIVYQNTNLGIDVPALNPDSIVLYKENNIFKINAGKTIIKNVKVFDVRGRLVYEENDINASTAALTDLKAEQQVLLVQITSDQNEVITKKAVY
ncbi:T9SS sorting signal type C domain-containing protein [Flavobacterium sp. 3HN19-14]|uniref:T9SS sorting signal type C domain-containing protein n=1 Tax=Flavobacterium sp. 3HN19-14 TaxID=3448133 RepID=UPI003EDE9335